MKILFLLTTVFSFAMEPEGKNKGINKRMQEAYRTSKIDCDLDYNVLAERYLISGIRSDKEEFVTELCGCFWSNEPDQRINPVLMEKAIDEALKKENGHFLYLLSFDENRDFFKNKIKEVSKNISNYDQRPEIKEKIIDIMCSDKINIPFSENKEENKKILETEMDKAINTNNDKIFESLKFMAEKSKIDLDYTLMMNLLIEKEQYDLVSNLLWDKIKISQNQYKNLWSKAFVLNNDNLLLALIHVSDNFSEEQGNQLLEKCKKLEGQFWWNLMGVLYRKHNDNTFNGDFHYTHIPFMEKMINEFLSIGSFHENYHIISRDFSDFDVSDRDLFWQNAWNSPYRETILWNTFSQFIPGNLTNLPNRLNISQNIIPQVVEFLENKFLENEFLPEESVIQFFRLNGIQFSEAYENALRERGLLREQGNVNVGVSESIMKINPETYHKNISNLLKTHVNTYKRNNISDYVLPYFEKNCENIDEKIKNHLKNVIKALSNQKWFSLAILHVEYPYWINRKLSQEEIEQRWNHFFKHFISGAGFSNYGKTNTTSCSPDRACIEAFSEIGEPFATLSILPQRNAGPLTETIELSNPNEGEVDAVYEMGINRACLDLFETLLKDSSVISFQLTEEKNIKFLEDSYLNIIRPKKTCIDDVMVQGNFSSAWKKKTYNQEIDFTNEKWSKVRHNLAQAIYQVIKYKTFNPSVSYDAKWLNENIDSKNKSYQDYAVEIALKIKELKAQNMIVEEREDLYNLYLEAVRNTFPVEGESKKEKLEYVGKFFATLLSVYEKYFPNSQEIKEEKPYFENTAQKSEEEEITLSGSILAAHRYLLSGRPEGYTYTREQFIDDLMIERNFSKEDAELAFETYQDLLKLKK